MRGLGHLEKPRVIIRQAYISGSNYSVRTTGRPFPWDLQGIIEQEGDERDYLLDKRIRDRFLGRLIAHSRNRGEKDK